MTTKPFAFNVAVTGHLYPALGSYDADAQQFMWEGDSTVSLGQPLCTKRPAGHGGRANCSTTSTQCYFSGITCTPMSWQGCYTCDYG